MKRAPNLDRNHHEIVNALRGRGCSVHSLASLGKGTPDLLIGFQGDWAVAEVKAFPAGTVKGELSEDQRRWRDEARGTVIVLRSVEDVGFYFRHVAGSISTEKEGK